MRLLAATGVLAAGVLAAVVFSGVGRPEAALSETGPATGGITTSGTGTVETVPDRASFSFGVETVAPTAREALEANGERLRRVIDALRESGVDLRDIRTQQLSLQTRYADDGKTVTGYAATNTVQAEVEELARAGAIVDAAVQAGANQVWGPSLSRSDRSALARDALRDSSVDLRDIRTQQLSLQTRYADDGKTVTGYAATNTVQAEVEQLARAGATVDAAVQAGANQVWGPSLSRSDRDALARDALRKAVADARAKAEALAEAAGVRLGGAVKIVEGTSAYDPPMPYAERAAVLDAATPVQPGTEHIEATVSVTFDLS